jgi:release factor glutamine methyltransferase
MRQALTSLVRPAIEPLPGVYRPSADSYLLLDAFAQQGPSERSRVLDLCCGSGVQGIAAAMIGHDVVSVDLDRQAVKSARRNADLNGVQLVTLQGELFEPVRGISFDAVLVNPPYVPTPARGDYRRHTWADGGRDGRAVIDRVCREAAEFLNPDGSLWLVQSSLADVDATFAELEAHGLCATVVADRAEPFGPLSTERIEYFQANGFVEADDVTERLVVLRASRCD